MLQMFTSLWSFMHLPSFPVSVQAPRGWNCAVCATVALFFAELFHPMWHLVFMVTWFSMVLQFNLQRSALFFLHYK